MNRFALTKRAFTLVELLVVIGIIVIALALSVPAFSFLTGARSIEAGENAVAAMLGRARTEAINRSGYVGVLVFLNPKTDRTTLALVELDPANVNDPDPYDQYKSWQGGFDYKAAGLPGTGITADRVLFITQDNDLGMNSRPMVKVYRCILDHNSSGANQPPASGGGNTPLTMGIFQRLPWWEEYKPGTLDQLDVADFVNLPPGVGAQLIYAGNSNSERYVRTGLILFDPQGRLAYREFKVKWKSQLGETLQLKDKFPIASNILYSSFGVVLYDRNNFVNQSGHTEGDTDYFTPSTVVPMASPSAYNPDELAEETWLDQNTTPLMVNRFSGALMSGAQ